MADVKPPWDGSSLRARDRGQLFLVAALALGIALVALALILNSAIYTENLATRQSEVGSATEVVELQENVRNGMGGLAEYVNRNHPDEDYPSKRIRYVDAVGNWSRLREPYEAMSGHRTTISADGVRNGTRLVDDNNTTPFVPVNETPSQWTVAKDVNIRQFRMTVESDATNLSDPSASDVKSTLDSPGSRTVPFVVDIDDGSSPTRVAIYRDGTETVVMVKDESEYPTCRTNATDPRVDLTDASLGRQACPALDRIEPNGTHSVTYYNPGEITGTWTLTVDRPAASFHTSVDNEAYANQCAGSRYDDATGGNTPYATPAIYASTLLVEYVDANLDYQGAVRAAPGEVGGPARAPTIDSFEVDDDSDEFEVDWSASDPDGDLTAVEVLANGSVEQDWSYSNVTSASESGVEVDESGSSVEITIIATDDAGNTRQVTEVHNDDGDDTGCPP